MLHFPIFRPWRANSQTCTFLQSYMMCFSILCFSHIANKFNDILSILKEVIIFPEKGDLFSIGKTNMNILRSKFDFFSFTEFPDVAMKLAAYAEEMPTTIYLHMEALKKVGRKVSIVVLTMRNKSIYSGKITTYLNIKRMSLNLLTTSPKKENRDANHLQRSWWHQSSTLGSD